MNPPGPVLVLDRPGIGARLIPESMLDLARCTQLDNNRSERALRTAAVGRKNFLFVGHDEAGRNLAGLYSLVATCLANEINPETYLADVLTRVC